MLNFDAFLETLPIIGRGYGGVFAVTIVVILMVKLLSVATSKKK